MMQPEADMIDLTKLVEEVPLPCDWFSGWPHTPHADAQWVVRRTSHGCESDGQANLICVHCKDYLLLQTTVIECKFCATVFTGPELASSIEPL